MAYRSACRRAIGPVKISNSHRPSSSYHSTRTYVEPLADPALGGYQPSGTVRAPSWALIAARFGDLVIAVAVPSVLAFLALLGARWVAGGFLARIDRRGA
jgi:hypothetical protein